MGGDDAPEETDSAIVTHDFLLPWFHDTYLAGHLDTAPGFEDPLVKHFWDKAQEEW